jgi:cytidylate kinase
MSISREEKEKHVLDFHYNKGYIYRDIAKDLRMSPKEFLLAQEWAEQEFSIHELLY